MASQPPALRGLTLSIGLLFCTIAFGAGAAFGLQYGKNAQTKSLQALDTNYSTIRALDLAIVAEATAMIHDGRERESIGIFEKLIFYHAPLVDYHLDAEVDDPQAFHRLESALTAYANYYADQSDPEPNLAAFLGREDRIRSSDLIELGSLQQRHRTINPE